MNTQFQQEFQHKWGKYFPGAELPMAYSYTDEVAAEERLDSQDEEHCVIASFQRVRQGHTFVYRADSPGCKGWKRYAGSSQSLRPKFEFFFSCGIPGEIEGERYKKAPDLVGDYLESHPAFQAPGRFLVLSVGTNSPGTTGLLRLSFSPRRMCFQACSPWRTMPARIRTA